jgi:tetrapyrrole methylase family protein / MazG family protein
LESESFIVASRRKLKEHIHRGKKSVSTPQTSSGARRKSARPRSVGKLFEALVALQARLRAPNGCPWDREQTHESLRTYLIEETYEVLETLDSGDAAKLSEELGDLLLQIVFHAEIARGAGRFDIADVIEQIHTKMVRRHPHVFGKEKASTAAQVLKNWEQLKTAERAASRRDKGQPDAPPPSASLMDGLPKTLPALLEAYQLTRRASRVGFDWEHIDGLFDKLREEAGELREALSQPHAARTEEEVGDLLFVAVNVARFLGVDPEIALKKSNRKFSARFRQMEQEATRIGRPLAESSKDELENLWQSSKRNSAPAENAVRSRAKVAPSQ